MHLSTKGHAAAVLLGLDSLVHAAESFCFKQLFLGCWTAADQNLLSV